MTHKKCAETCLFCLQNFTYSQPQKHRCIILGYLVIIILNNTKFSTIITFHHVGYGQMAQKGPVKEIRDAKLRVIIQELARCGARKVYVGGEGVLVCLMLCGVLTLQSQDNLTEGRSRRKCHGSPELGAA